MNVAGLTVATQLPLHKKFSLFAEGGLGIVTRKGFAINNKAGCKKCTYDYRFIRGGVAISSEQEMGFTYSTLPGRRLMQKINNQPLFFIRWF